MTFPSDDLADNLINYDSFGRKIEPTFNITVDEAKALNKLIQLHHGLLRESPEEYVQILRLINGLQGFLDHQK